MASATSHEFGDVGGRAEPVLVEGGPGDREGVVHADRLAGDLAPVAEDREVGREVGEAAGRRARRLEAVVLRHEEPGGPDRLDGGDPAVRHDERRLEAEAARDGCRHEEEDQPDVREDRRELRVLVPVSVEVGPSLRLLLPDPVARPPERTGDRLGVEPVGERPPGEPRVEVGVGLDHPDLVGRCPEAREPVDRADHDREEEDDEREAEPPGVEDGEGEAAIFLSFFSIFFTLNKKINKYLNFQIFFNKYKIQRKDIDLKVKKDSGLFFISKAVTVVQGVASFHLKTNHRHPIVEPILEIYKQLRD